jgi:uncharacterized protein
MFVSMVTVYLLAVGYLYAVQRDFVFQPSGSLPYPAAVGLSRVTPLQLFTPDGASLTVWHAPPAGGLPVFLYFHGNAGNLSHRASRFRQIVASGFGLLAVSYRGYPGSGGQPTELDLVGDGLMLFDWLAARNETIVVYGESLGTGIAAAVASERQAAALVLESPYTAAVDIAAKQYPWVPVGLLMKDQFRTRERIGDIEEPLLVIHGSDDETIPVDHGRRLYELANPPKRLVIVEGAGHGDLWRRGIWQMVLDFLHEEGVLALTRGKLSWSGARPGWPAHKTD